MNFLEEVRERILIFDGSKGFMMQMYGLPAGDAPDSFNIKHPEIVSKVHRDYVDAGCDVIQTNTFTANRIILERHGLDDKTYEINREGARLAAEAADGKALVAASIGPTGMLFKPFGQLDYDKAFDVFSEQVKAVVDGGADIINFETFTDIMEMKAALNAAKSVCDLPVVCSMAFEENKRTLMGTEAWSVAHILKKAGADMVGANCSFGPGHMLDIVKDMAKTGEFLSVKPNAGLPHVLEGKTVYNQCAVDFVAEASFFASYNARLIGGCCGTTPEFLSLLREKVKLHPYEGEILSDHVICSSSRCVDLDSEYTMESFEINDSMDEYDISDEIMELAYGESDVLEIIYSGTSVNTLRDIILENYATIKQPLILSGENQEAIRIALDVYPGVTGCRRAIPGGRGYELL